MTVRAGSVLTPQWLRSAAAIRPQCAKVMALAETGALRDWELNLGGLGDVAEFVIKVMRDSYPALDIPYHSRWRHFEGSDNARGHLAAALRGLSASEEARCRFELAIISVLLDAGAGMKWRWQDSADGTEYSKSEGLALASLTLFGMTNSPVHQGSFANGATEGPWRVSPTNLAALDLSTLGTAFQVSNDNPLVGLEGRLSLLRRLGKLIAAQPLFRKPDAPEGQPRLGNLFDQTLTRVRAGKLDAAHVLDVILEALGGIWPARATLEGVDLGDTWFHPELAPTESDRSNPNAYVPFHKLSQWLTYSLVEPLETAGVKVFGLDHLTGLPEYRNGGLFVDLGVLQLKQQRQSARGGAFEVDSTTIVSWRALTVILLDRIAALIRSKLNLTDDQLPLAKVLQGGTWTAGRQIAASRRADGGPPLAVVSDGTVF